MGYGARLKLANGGTVPFGSEERPKDFHEPSPVPADEQIGVPCVLREDGEPYSILAGDPRKVYEEPVALAYVHTGMVHEGFTESLCRMLRADPHIVAMHKESSCNVVMNRNLVMARFLETPEVQGRWLLWLDTDMVFPPYTAATLLKVAVETEADIVAAPYRLTNGCSTFGTASKTGGYNTQGKFLFDRAYLIDAAGTGCMLISRKILKRMKEAYHDREPWPFCGYDRIVINGKPEYESEDYSLCRRAQEIGAKVVGYTGVVLQHLKTAPLVFDGLEKVLEMEKAGGKEAR